ncbi:cupin domain-containing protein [Xenophilus arseniciresistens]|uniref:Cupin domain-containing protein n=1 Tax=Xenophilus arseniciresistens TaxID=1283306 RepID=A0AAE3N6D5_9BURK|nr:cupin domain-containing protein [Xenophilus arseniciresistens]MDA7415713.1 cupin domain-containing protein [Xenophilus arseniciresistens]
MDIDSPLPLLGGLSPAQFMRRHWQKKPLLVRQAIPGFSAPVSRPALFDLAARDDVESRLITHDPAKGWSLRHGPVQRRALPPLSRRAWTLLVQGVDLHDEAAHQLMQAFRFLPDARLDDLMISYASDGGGVGPHFDSYDVFLLQASGRREWRIGRQKDLTLREGLPLKVLENFEPEQSWVLEPGDMLYLPPRYAHDGVAVGGDCMTYSIGLRSPAAQELALDLITRIAEAGEDDDEPRNAGASGRRYGDAAQLPVTAPASIPAALQGFAREAVRAALSADDTIDCALGESLTEPKLNVWFDEGEAPRPGQGLRLDRRTRMLYDERHVFINGESYRAAGRDATLMRRLADRRVLSAAEFARASADAQALVGDWCEAGWVHAD